MGVGWEQAGEAWGHRARDWATLAEPAMAPAYIEVLDHLAVGPATRVLDVACGAGGALVAARRHGATVAGQDASRALLAVAGRRLPDADLRLGDQDDLPWPDASFDVVTSFNGIWGGGERAVAEVVRVAAPGARVALTFWGDMSQVEWLSFLIPLNLLGPPGHLEASAADASIGESGVAEAMLQAAGLDVVAGLDVEITSEWPDDEIAWRVMAASGVAWAAIEHAGEDAVRTACLEAIADRWTPETGYRMTNVIRAVIASKPS